MADLRVLKNNIHDRFDRLTISLAKTQLSMGIQPEGKVSFEVSEQGDARRKLLRVEKQAIRDKELNRKSQQNYVDSIRELVHAAVLERVQAALVDEEALLIKVLGYDERLTELLDSLAVRASSISKIEPAAANMPWLYDDIIKMVNSPKYKRFDARGKVVVLENFKVALSFLGIDNLKMVVPTLAFKRWLPQITDPYPDIKKRLFEAAIGTSVSCKKIAKLNDVSENQAFLLGLFHDLGKLVITRLYFKFFEEVQRDALIEAHDNKKREEHSALSQIVPSDEYLMSLFDQFAYPISAKLISKMNFKRVFIAAAMEEFSQNIPIASMTPMGKVLAQGVAYNRYRTLKMNKLIDLEDSKDFLRQFNFPRGALSLLKITDLRQLDIELDQK